MRFSFFFKLFDENNFAFSEITARILLSFACLCRLITFLFTLPPYFLFSPFSVYLIYFSLSLFLYEKNIFGCFSSCSSFASR